MINIKLGSNVQCSDGPCGKATYIVFRRGTRKLTQIVVENKEFPDNPNRLVPISNVKRAVQTLVSLGCTIKEVTLMKPFTTTKFIQESSKGRAASTGAIHGYWGMEYGPGTLDRYSVVVDDTGFDAVEEKNIGKDEIAIAAGMEIHATDGKIGKLDELIMDPKSEEVTHILMKEGHLWGKRDMVIPITAVKSAFSGVIILNIDKKGVEEVPTLPLKH
jgi:hypothetical protein